jgi:enoyl-CoA hydratase/carnithine racemase
MELEFVRYEKRDRIAYVTINRPEVMNALHPPANDELSRVWDDFAADPDVWVGILTGAGERAFSAGNDLKYTALHGMPRMPKGGFGGLVMRFDLSAAASRSRSRATSSWRPITRALGSRSRRWVSWPPPVACTASRVTCP